MKENPGDASRQSRRKEDRERFFVEMLLAKSSLPLRIVTHCEDEDGPDFIMTDACSEFALEVTQLFIDRDDSGSDAKASESKRARFLSRVAKSYYESGGLPILVQALHLPDSPSGNVGDICKILIASRPVEDWDAIDVGVPGLGKIRLEALPASLGGYSHWQSIRDHVGSPRQLTHDDLDKAIEDKAGKLDKYRRFRSRVALLLVVERHLVSGFLDWPTEVGVELRGFEAIYLLIHPDRAGQLA